MLFIDTAANVIGVLRSRANAHPDDRQHAIAASAVPEDVACPNFVAICFFLTREVARWPSQGTPVGHQKSTRPPASGSKSSKGSGADSNDPMSKHIRLNFGILVTKNRNTYTKLGLPRSRFATSQKALLDRPHQVPQS